MRKNQIHKIIYIRHLQQIHYDPIDYISSWILKLIQK
jgi:hypothetical protein